jgi:hypothetical protein
MNRRGSERLPLLILLALLALPALAAEVGTMRQGAALMSAPYRDATTAGDVAQNTTVTILERRGAWLRVKTPSSSGWVRLHQVRVGEGPEKKASGAEGVGMLWNVGQTGRSGSTGIVATTGIRGFDAEALKNAKPNPQAVQSLEGFRASKDGAAAYAKSAGLKEANVEFLPNVSE